MGACLFILRVGFLAFFALNAWNTLSATETHTSKFKESYKNFETAIHTRTGIQLPEILRHSNVHKHSDLIVKGLAWAQLALAAASLLICGGMTSIVGLVYFIQQVLHLNFANISLKTSFAQFEQIALAVGLLFASVAISGCYKYSKHCGAQKNCPVANDQTSQAQSKKKH